LSQIKGIEETSDFMSLQKESSKIQKILQTIGKLTEQNELSSLVGIGLNLENIFVPNEGNSKLIFLEETFERFQTWRVRDLDAIDSEKQELIIKQRCKEFCVKSEDGHNY
jgi:hypothetical protein